MKIAAFRTGGDRHIPTVEAFIDGVLKKSRPGVSCKVYETDYPETVDADVVCLIGPAARLLMPKYRADGVTTVYLDKGYIRKGERWGGMNPSYFRVAVNSDHPTEYLGRLNSPPDRAARIWMVVAPWRQSGVHVVIAGSSAKFHRFHGLPDPTAYAEEIVSEIRKRTDRPIVYRPKESWRDAVPVPGASFSRGVKTIWQELYDAHALVTYGSSACFEAAVSGIPSIVLGNAVARPISSVSLDDIETPKMVTPYERGLWLNELAYCQWTLPEMQSGLAWNHVRHVMDVLK